MSTRTQADRQAQGIDRRSFLGAVTAVAGTGLGGALASAGGNAAFAQAQRTPADSMPRRIERFERRVDLIRQSLDIPGMSVAVVHQQNVVWAGGFGVVDLAKGTAANENTPYPIASVTKPFAAALIMRLVEAGKLDLDEKLSTYDPDYAQWCTRLKTSTHPSARNYHCDTERITVRHHLTHTAQGKPGTNYDYNGLLFSRLSAVVDALAPKGFVRALEEDILAPLGMRDTALGQNDPNKRDVIARMARPYRLDRERNLVEPDVVSPPFSSVSASAGIISTVMDLAKFDIAIDRDLVYSPQAKQQVWTPGTSPSGLRFPYGLGWCVFTVSGTGTRLPWHYGWYPDAFSSLLFKVPDWQLTLILLACTDRASSVFWLGNGDPMRSGFVAAFVDTFAPNS